MEKDNWVFEISSGYDGYRNKRTSEWIYSKEFEERFSAKKDKTVEDYIKIHIHLEQYCQSMIFKSERKLAKYPNAFEEKLKMNAYKDILYKLNPQNKEK